jgi:hypothetical protein
MGKLFIGCVFFYKKKTPFSLLQTQNGEKRFDMTKSFESHR